jgi:hypothetical protein
MAVEKALRMRVRMATLLVLMAPPGSVAEVARAWTRNLNAPRKAAGRATQGLSISIVINSITRQSRFITVIFLTAFEHLSDRTCVTGIETGILLRDHSFTAKIPC